MLAEVAAIGASLVIWKGLDSIQKAFGSSK
jgi:hypothetical protein